jgi:hypothetical protein
MKVEDALREEIKEVKAYMTPDGKLYPSRDEAVQAYLASQSWAPYWALALGLVAVIVLAALVF